MCLSHFPSLLHSDHFHSKVKSDRLGIHFSDDLFFVLPNIFISFFSADLFCHKCNTLNSTIFLKLLSLFLFLLSFCPCFHAPPALLPNFLCPAFLSISCLCSKSCSSSTLHGEILCKGRKPGWEWG